MYVSTSGKPPVGFSYGINRLGAAYYRDEHFALDHRHGRVPLEEALELHPEFVDRLGEGLSQADLRGAAYLDIETGVLSSHAFLVGVGTFEGFGFRVRQFF